MKNMQLKENVYGKKKNQSLEMDTVNKKVITWLYDCREMSR